MMLDRRSCGGRFLVALAVLAAFVVGESGIGWRASLGAVADETASVRLTIDYGDGVEKTFRLDWKAEMTVLDALEAASRHPRGIKVERRGSGATAFVTQIDDLKNEGQGRNWIFEVNGVKGKTSSGIHKLVRDDRILWKFTDAR